MQGWKLTGLPEVSAGLRWDGLAGSSAALGLAHVVLNSPRPLLAVCPTDEEALRVAGDLRFFLRLAGAGSAVEVALYPSRPSDADPARVTEPWITWKRLTALHRLIEYPGETVVVASLRALAQLTIPKDVLVRSTDIFGPGVALDRDDLARRLSAAGYDREPLVDEPGTFAVRGGVLDFFPPHLERPVRMELSGDEIESVRAFDPATQRSLEHLTDVTWIPAREILFDPERIPAARSALKDLADLRDLPPSARAALEDAIDEQRYLPSMDSLLPLFFERPGSLFDFLRDSGRCVLVDPFSLRREREQLREEFERRGEEFQTRQLLAFPPDRLSLSLETVRECLESRSHIELSDVAVEDAAAPRHACRVELLEDLRRELTENRKKAEPLAPLLRALHGWRESGFRVLFVAHSQEAAGKLHDLLLRHEKGLTLDADARPELLELADRKPVVTSGELFSGFMFTDARVVFVSEHELFRERKHALLPQVARGDLFSSISELVIGDPVVHLDFGVGIFRGLEKLRVASVENDFLHLEYAGGDKLYLPIYRLNRIQKYIGADGGSPKVDRLGNASAWEKARKKAEKAVAEMAQELLGLYASRKVARASALGRPDESYFAFESDFPFEETRDQTRTLEDVLSDLESEKPMDRLVCGDVGFGKTEIALRAGFRVAMEGKQVAVLVPTTVLAQQHYETFRERMKSFPIHVEFLSRFKSPAQQKTVLKGLKEGTVDVVIGTHRLLSKDVAFRDLGLLVIDEEHRFGVKHKERIQKFRNNVHVMTLTATPIPRTLQMSMAGIRDLSVINTPPLDRKAIHTYLCRFDDAVISGAIRKELSRHGQIFFVHNKVETIHAMGTYLKRLVPQARIGIAHGQMAERDLEEVMIRFLRKEFDLLLCTTIIESGLDIPSANTLLVNRADQLGLAQLYQLRGRVGRSEREAYAYLLIPGEELIARDALKRLKVLKRFTELGSGLKIALHDLEIRGAGNLLGPSQSGHIAAVGLELYTQLLDREVRRLKGEIVREEVDPEIQCYLPAFLPEEYVASTGERLLLYKRLSSMKDEAELERLSQEIRDRFGAPPPVVENLLDVIRLKLLAREIGVSTLRLSGDQPSLEFADGAPVNLDRVLSLVRTDKRLKLRPDNRIVLDLGEAADTLAEVRKILQKLK